MLEHVGKKSDLVMRAQRILEKIRFEQYKIIIKNCQISTIQYGPLSITVQFTDRVASSVYLTDGLLSTLGIVNKAYPSTWI